MTQITDNDNKILQKLIQNYEISKNYLFAGERFIIVENEQEAKRVSQIITNLDDANKVSGILIRRENPLQKYELFRKVKKRDVCRAVLRYLSPIRKRTGRISFRAGDIKITLTYEVLNAQSGDSSGE